MGLNFVALKGRHFREYDGQIIQIEMKQTSPTAPPTPHALFFGVLMPRRLKY